MEGEGRGGGEVGQPRDGDELKETGTEVGRQPGTCIHVHVGRKEGPKGTYVYVYACTCMVVRSKVTD